jgi:hypothetical protein
MERHRAATKAELQVLDRPKKIKIPKVKQRKRRRK